MGMLLAAEPVMASDASTSPLVGLESRELIESRRASLEL